MTHHTHTCRYADRLAGKMRVLLITNDSDSRQRGTAEGVEALSECCHLSVSYLSVQLYHDL
jgi:hypothetical protein